MLITPSVTVPPLPLPPPTTGTGNFTIDVSPNAASLDRLQNLLVEVGLPLDLPSGPDAYVSFSGVPTGCTFAIDAWPYTGYDNLQITPGASTPAGTYFVGIVYNDGANASTCYFTLQVNDATYPDPLPANTAGTIIPYSTPSSITMAQADQLVIYVQAFYGSGAFPPATMGFYGLPDFLTVFYQQQPNFSGSLATLFSSPDTPPGTYPLFLNASGDGDEGNWPMTLVITPGPPAAPAYSASRAKGRYFGVVRHSQQSRSALRRMAIPVNPNTPSMSRWRHVFGTAKAVYRAMGPNGANTTPIGGVLPLTAWIAQALSFSAYRTYYLPDGSAASGQLFGPLATVEAYIVMVQTTMAQLQQPPLPTPAVTVASGEATPVNPSPHFDAISSISGGTDYDSDYQVSRMLVFATFLGAQTNPVEVSGAAIAFGLLVTASPAYTNYYSPPPASQWSPILYGPADSAVGLDALPSWLAAFGALPDKGSIKFSLQTYDPISGSVSNQVSHVVSWEQGTLRGFIRGNWLGPIFNAGFPASPIIQAAGTTVDYPISVVGSPSQTGWGGGAGVPYGGTITFQAAVQAGNSIAGYANPIVTFNPLTIPSGDTSIISGTMTVTTAATLYNPACVFTLSGTDGISTSSASVQINTT
jgi:hypothetical protein